MEKKLEAATVKPAEKPPKSAEKVKFMKQLRTKFTNRTKKWPNYKSVIIISGSKNLVQVCQT
jgi:hypothetical protein